MTTPRIATYERTTRETAITLRLNLDGSGNTDIATGIGFLDHMLTALALHARFDLSLKCQGDLDVDDHHTAEDCAIALGRALEQAIGDRTSIARYGWAAIPMDESLAQCAIDLGGRRAAAINLGLTRERIGQLACENITHFFDTLAMNTAASLHIDVIRGTNDHHRAEAAFKSLAYALRQAVAISDDPTSTKGVLD